MVIPLNVARSGLGSTFCNGRMYAVGGSNLKVVVEYDFQTEKWQQLEPLTTDGAYCKLFPMKNDWLFGNDEL